MLRTAAGGVCCFGVFQEEEATDEAAARQPAGGRYQQFIMIARTIGGVVVIGGDAVLSACRSISSAAQQQQRILYGGVARAPAERRQARCCVRLLFLSCCCRRHRRPPPGCYFLLLSLRGAAARLRPRRCWRCQIPLPTKERDRSPKTRDQNGDSSIAEDRRRHWCQRCAARQRWRPAGVAAEGPAPPPRSNEDGLLVATNQRAPMQRVVRAAAAPHHPGALKVAATR